MTVGHPMTVGAQDRAQQDLTGHTGHANAHARPAEIAATPLPPRPNAQPPLGLGPDTRSINPQVDRDVMTAVNFWNPEAITPDGHTAGGQVIADFFRRLSDDDRRRAFALLDDIAVVTSSDAWQRLPVAHLRAIRSWLHELEALVLRALGMNLGEFQQATGLNLIDLAALAAKNTNTEGQPT